jgi:hypothetical protein
MWLPTKGQVDAASRHVITAAGVAVTIFGLQAKGVDIAQVTAAIQALGSTVNDVIVVAGTIAGLYAAWKASHTASPIEQAKSVAATGAKVVGSQALADATPGEPNIMSSADSKVVSK